MNKDVWNIAWYYHHEMMQIDEKNKDTINNVWREFIKTCSQTTFRQKFFIETELFVSKTLRRAVTEQAQSWSLSHK